MINEVMIAGFIPAGSEWILIVLVVLLLFGGSKLPQLARALGQSKRAFREGIDEGQKEDVTSTKTLPATSQATALSDDELFAEARRRQQTQVK